MKKLNIKVSLFLIVGLSAFSGIIISIIRGLDFSNVINFIKIIPTIVTIDTIFITVFVKYAWKWKIFKHWLVKTPNLNGTWSGHIHSNWINPTTGEKPDPIPVLLTIKQSFYYISCIMRTNEMRSYSISSGIDIDDENQNRILSYIYTSKPRALVESRSRQHDGAIVFEIIENPNRKLIGNYWTQRNTSGEIRLDYYSKIRLEQLPEHFKGHPVTEKENDV